MAGHVSHPPTAMHCLSQSLSKGSSFCVFSRPLPVERSAWNTHSRPSSTAEFLATHTMSVASFTSWTCRQQARGGGRSAYHSLLVLALCRVVTPCALCRLVQAVSLTTRPSTQLTSHRKDMQLARCRPHPLPAPCAPRLPGLVLATPPNPPPLPSSHTPPGTVRSSPLLTPGSGRCGWCHPAGPCSQTWGTCRVGEAAVVGG
jgi:hypothetical protein